ncbi:MAG TPA: efflux RND transporter periplasmic adaptor subunit [Gemmataceae bacterium]|nr:efflux RND transporter periplasmic adaptor subunit [Gemmataceae bacterium]
MNTSSFWWASRILPMMVLGLGLFGGCNNASPQGTSKKVVAVTATTPVTGEVTDYQDFTGRLDALKTVDIRARVSGFIMTAPFKEGDMVHEGDLLFQIDRRTYQATLNQTEANLRQAIADRNLQERNTSRARRMIESRSIAQEDYDTTLATYEKSKATVGSMEAARDMARLYLDFTQVTAPLSGRISRRLVDPGNLIIADTTPLTTIVSDNPLYAYFDVDERTYLDLMDTASAGHASWLTELQFPVMMRLANEEQFSRSGKVNFVDNRVNATTGTIRMRGVFDNPTGVLKSGLFVRIRLPIGKPYQAIMVPGAALARDQGRWYAYVVNGKHEVERRDVELGQEIQGLQVIKKGLSRTERVIISGMQRVKPGAPVEETMQPPPKAPASPLARLVNALPPVVAAKHSDKETKRQGDKEPGKADREAKKEVSGGS